VSAPDKSWGAEWTDMTKDPGLLALARCRKEGGKDCQIQFSFCTHS